MIYSCHRLRIIVTDILSGYDTETLDLQLFLYAILEFHSSEPVWGQIVYITVIHIVGVLSIIYYFRSYNWGSRSNKWILSVEYQLEFRFNEWSLKKMNSTVYT